MDGYCTAVVVGTLASVELCHNTLIESFLVQDLVLLKADRASLADMVYFQMAVESDV